ncbi:nucleoporin NUP42 [Clinocottus analis]|uniref:nucleoporin NUP42 n=1 Tax=Clinocottus analis TaxID=304258 RepID=UPI0035C2087A
MPVCNFFIQGRCRYGDKCWNEHPSGGGGGKGGGGYNNNNNSYNSAPQQQSRGGGGFGNRVWVNPSQQKGSYIQPSSFSSKGTEEWGQGGSGGADWGRAGAGGGGGGNDWSRGGGGNDWGRGGGGNDWGRGGSAGRRDNASFPTQNKFSTLGTPSTFERGGGQQVPAGEEDDDKKLEIIQMDMDIWESSGQWGFSCYSSSKTPLSGFTDLSPEELRMEYLSRTALGDVQSYVNAVNQLLNQWRSRVQELKVMNPATRTALLTELNNPAPQASSSDFGSAAVFGSATSSKGFGAPAPAAANTFSFAAPSGGFGSSAAPPSSAGFGSALAAPTQPPSGFGSTTAASSAPNASSFSFAAPSTNKPAATSGFGSASGFSFTSTQNTGGGGFGSGFGAEAPGSAGSGSIFEQTSGGFGKTAAPPAAGAASNSLFSDQSNMTPEELNQFKAKRFTLGQIPLKPPPADMLVV